jgi:hypothetical protein
MDLLRWLEIVSLITTLIGLYLIGEKRPAGFMVFNISLLCQAYIFYQKTHWFLLIQMAVLILFNLYNYSKWVGGFSNVEWSNLYRGVCKKVRRLGFTSDNKG